MSRGNRLNLFLLAVVAVLVALAVYEPGIEKPQAAPTLLSLQRESVEHILIRRRDKETIELQRDRHGRWQLLQPVQIAASEARIDSLLRVTNSKSLGSFPAAETELADYRLDEPAVELVLNHNTRLAFGNNTPLDHRRYVLLEDKVHLISDTLYYHLIGAYPTFVRQQPLPRAASIQRLKLPGLELSWRNDRWQIEPEPEHYQPDQVTALLDAWQYASAMQVKRYAGQTGQPISVQLKGNEQPLRFQLIESEGELILARPELGLQYHFPGELAAELLGLPEQANLAGTDQVN